jgi:hypothetical protein
MWRNPAMTVGARRTGTVGQRRQQHRYILFVGTSHRQRRSAPEAEGVWISNGRILELSTYSRRRPRFRGSAWFIYSLDAAAGCVYWSFEADRSSAVR